MALSVFEGLKDVVTHRFRKANPTLVPSQTSEVPPPKSANDDLPLGNEDIPGVWEYYDRNVRLLKTRKGLRKEYDEMDEECPEVNSALNIYADNATRGTGDGDVGLTIVTKDQRVLNILTPLKERLHLDQGLWTLCRDVAKYGERMEEPIVDKQFDVVRLKPLPTEYIIPQRDKWGRWESPAYKQVDDNGDPIAEFEEWQVVHFANKKSRGDLVGTGYGFAARKAFKQLRMMEDAVVIARLTRAHHRLAYMVDTGQLTPEEAQKHLQVVKSKLRKRRMMNPHTGKMDLNVNPLSNVEDDIFVAVNHESKADVKTLQGDLTVGNLHDLEYFQQKIFTAYIVPKAFLAHEKDTNTKAVVSQLDIQFARSVRHLQDIVCHGFRQVADLQLLLKGIDPTAVKYELCLPTISVADELRVWQTEQLRVLTAQLFKQLFWPSDEWLLTNLLGYDAEDVQALLKNQTKPDKFNGLYQAPKVGTVAKAKEAADLIAQLPTDEFQNFIQHVEDLRVLCDLQLEERRRMQGDR